MVIILFTRGGGVEQDERGLIKKQTKITTYTETYFQNEGKRRKGKVAVATSYKAQVGQERTNHFGS